MSEFSWIASLREALGGGLVSPAGIGDDGAVLGVGSRVVVADMMVEGVHFDLAWSRVEDVAWKLYASNASDVLAMGARPDAWLLTLALPSDGRADDVASWIRGLGGARSAWGGGALIGGDTTRTRGGLVASLTMFGTLERPAWTRDRFLPGQRLWVDGVLGFAAAGLDRLRREGPVEGCAFVAQHRRPAAPAGVGDALSTEVTGAIDVSDGLVADLTHAAQASGVRLVLERPLPGAQELLAYARGLAGDDAPALVDSWQLAGGDDYIRVASSRGCPGRGWVEIGRVCEGPAGVVDARQGDARPLTNPGYDHMREPAPAAVDGTGRR